MDIKTGIRQLFKDNFTVGREWLDFYFSTAYDERCALTAEQDGAIASSLMLDSYSMKLGDSLIDTGYIFGASTARRQRGKGLMSALLKDALAEARNRGLALVNLIPASDRLYFYYERFGFTTVFYSERQRYTSAHRFNIGDRYHRVDVDYDDFNRLELMRRATVIHSRDDFDYAVSDTSLDGGRVVAVADDDGVTCAVAFATPGNDSLHVRILLAVDDNAAEAVMGEMKKEYPDLMFVVDACPGSNPASLCRQGMTRITDVGLLLDAVAANDPASEQVIRVHDSLIPQNNGVYIISGGAVTYTDATIRRLTLDVDVSTLARIIFNSPRVGAVFGLSSLRPTLQLMPE